VVPPLVAKTPSSTPRVATLLAVKPAVDAEVRRMKVATNAARPRRVMHHTLTAGDGVVIRPGAAADVRPPAYPPYAQS
jgi:hypothetical protein